MTADRQLHIDRAKQLEQEGSLDQASKEWQELLEANPHDPLAYRSVMRITATQSERRGEWAEAEALWTAFLERFPDDNLGVGKQLRCKAELDELAGAWRKAVDGWIAVIAVQRRPWHWGRLVRALIAAGDSQRLEALLAGSLAPHVIAKDEAEQLEVIIGLIDLYASLGRYEDALHWSHKRLEAAPSPAARLERFEILLTGLGASGSATEAAGILESVAASDLPSVSTWLARSTATQLGVMLEEPRLRLIWNDLFGRLCSLRSDDPKLAWRLAELSDRLGIDSSQARERCQHLLRNADSAEALELRARCELIQEDFYAAAATFEQLRDAVLANPSESGLRSFERLNRVLGSQQVLGETVGSIVQSGKSHSFDLRTALVECAVILGKTEMALSLFNDLEKNIRSYDHRYGRIAAWQAACTGDLARAQELFDRFTWPATSTHFADLASDSLHYLEAAGSSLGVADPSEVVLFTRARDEAERLPTFLQHYRRLGVDRFVVIDHESADDTSEILRSQNDVTVINATGGFRASGAGGRWVNHLVDVTAPNNWILFVDVDEHLVFANDEPLQQTIRSMETSGADFCPAITLDLFPATVEELPLIPKMDGQGRLTPRYFFDDTYERLGSLDAPYVDIIGGVRRRLTVMDAHPYLIKTPLQHSGRGGRQLNNSHLCRPGRPAKRTAALLHFKWAGVSSANRSHFAYQEVRQQRGLANGKAALLGPDSVTFSGIEQLEHRGLLSMTSP